MKIEIAKKALVYADALKKYLQEHRHEIRENEYRSAIAHVDVVRKEFARWIVRERDRKHERAGCAV